MVTSTPRTVSEVIDAFGGPTELAQWAGICRPAVSNWRMKDEIPPGWHLRLLAEARRRHISIDPEIFDLTDLEAEALRSVFADRKRRRRPAPLSRVHASL